MKVLGLVMEANPLHYGHTYFINEAKRLVEPDYTIAIVSTNFSMRGDISVIDKFTKTKALLDCGIDLVLELPFLASVCSSDYFSYNAIKTLCDFKITDLAFGAEASSIDQLRKLQKLQKALDESIEVKENLNKGYSYSTATFKAIKMMTDDVDLIENFSLPNNTLAIQYLNALDSINKDVNTTLIKRIDNNYYDKEAKSQIASATSLRELLKNGSDITNYTPFKIDYINLLESEANLYKLFQYKVLLTDKNKLATYQGVNEGIENRLVSFIDSIDYDAFISNVETKRYTKTHIKRIILHILLSSAKTKQYYNYLRVLGFNDKGKEYIKSLDKETKAKIITSPKSSNDELLLNELQATKLYGIITSRPSLYLEEYKLPIVKGDKNA